MAEIKSRKTEVFLPFRGTNLQKAVKNAQISIVCRNPVKSEASLPYLLSLSINCSEKIASSAYTTV